jgi:hypothetical protein
MTRSIDAGRGTAPAAYNKNNRARRFSHRGEGGYRLPRSVDSRMSEGDFDPGLRAEGHHVLALRRKRPTGYVLAVREGRLGMCFCLRRPGGGGPSWQYQGGRAARRETCWLGARAWRDVLRNGSLNSGNNRGFLVFDQGGLPGALLGAAITMKRGAGPDSPLGLERV